MKPQYRWISVVVVVIAALLAGLFIHNRLDDKKTTSTPNMPNREEAVQ